MINRYMTLLTEELAADGIPDPLSQAFTLAVVWDDLCRLAGETAPTFVCQRFEGDSPLWDPAETMHGPRFGADTASLTS